LQDLRIRRARYAMSLPSHEPPAWSGQVMMHEADAAKSGGPELVDRNAPDASGPKWPEVNCSGDDQDVAVPSASGNPSPYITT
jgi:hypothetical protein